MRRYRRLTTRSRHPIFDPLAFSVSAQKTALLPGDGLARTLQGVRSSQLGRRASISARVIALDDLEL